MKKLLVTGPRQVEWVEMAIPPCPADGLLVRTTVTAISTGTEIRVYRAIPVDEVGEFLHTGVPFVLPTENGYSLAGQVVEVGLLVEGFEIGDRVFAGAAHQEYAAVPAQAATKLPPGLPDEQAVFLNILEVGHIALRRGRPSPGENLAIVGQGIIGLAALAYGRAFAFRTLAVDLSEQRLALARRLGADLALRPDEPEFQQRALDFFDGQGADLVLEAASVWPAIQLSMDIARPGGTIVVVARHTDLPAFSPVGHPYLGKDLTLLTSYGHEPAGRRWERKRSIALTLALWQKGLLDIAPLITHHFDRSQLPEAYARLDRGDVSMAGVVIHWP